MTSTYTALGELKSQTDNKLQLSTYGHDKLGRLRSHGTAEGISTWNYDSPGPNAIGKLKSRSSAGFTETYYYLGVGKRLSRVETNITPIGGSTSVQHNTNHTYDSSGRPLTTTYPGGFVLTREYNARGYLSKLKDGSTAIQTINDQDVL